MSVESLSEYGKCVSIEAVYDVERRIDLLFVQLDEFLDMIRMNKIERPLRFISNQIGEIKKLANSHVDENFKQEVYLGILRKCLVLIKIIDCPEYIVVVKNMAIDVIDLIEEENKANPLKRLCYAFIAIGKIDQALEIANLISDPRERESMISQVTAK
jgi:hypothetical protein